MKTPNSRGQIFSTDFILASVVFLFILTLSMAYSTEVANRVYLLQKDNARQLAALNAANALLYSPGRPANWENLPDLNSVSGIGLAKSGNEIHPAKLQRLLGQAAVNYGKVKNLLGLSKYDFRISVLQLQDRQSLAEFGLLPGSDQTVTAINRIAIYNNEEVIVRLRVFE